jgi:cytochrome c oxidase subunit 1
MIVPAMGVVNEIVTCLSRRSIYGYRAIAFANVGFALFSFLVWGHHMFVAGQSIYGAMIFSILSYLVAIFSAIKVFNWTATLYKGSVSFDTPMLYVFGFIGLFTFGGLTGLFLSALGLDIHVHDTYFIVAHFHYVMVGGMVMAYLGGLHFWWPKMTGKMYSEGWAKLAALLVFVGFNLTFFPQFIVGYLGMPRRYHMYAEEFQVLNILSTAGASVLGTGFTLPLIYMIYSLFAGPDAGPNPWKSTGLEWKTTSPPITENFEVDPIVTEPPYNYHKQEGNKLA